MLTNIRYILITALRDWLFTALMAGIVACALIAHMLGSTAIIETQEMTLAYTAASARVIIMTGLIVFACFHVRGAFDTKEIDVFLSRPITRTSLVLSYWLGFAVVAFLLVVPTVGLSAVEGFLHQPGFFYWGISLLLECWLVITVALFASFTLGSAVTSVMVSMGVYVIARLMGFFITYVPADVFKGVAMFIPRLDSCTRSEWLIYGLRNGTDIKGIAVQIVLFILVLMGLTAISFRRRQF